MARLEHYAACLRGLGDDDLRTESLNVLRTYFDAGTDRHLKGQARDECDCLAVEWKRRTGNTNVWAELIAEARRVRAEGRNQHGRAI
jgi:hypothetical protein